MKTIYRIKKRFVENSFNAALKMAPTSRMYDKLIDGDIKAHLTVMACGELPEDMLGSHFGCLLIK